MFNRRQFIKLGSFASSSVLFSFNCLSKDAILSGAVKSKKLTGGLAVQKVRTSKGAYFAKDRVAVSFELVNSGADPLVFKSLHVSLKNISAPLVKFHHTASIAENITIEPGAKYIVRDKEIWTVPDDAQLNALGIYIGAAMPDGNIVDDAYVSFFRVINASQLMTYAIESSLYKGIKVYSLDGGMSTEYAVVKTAENLTAGVANSWKTSAPGSGPNHVYSSQDFLERSVQQTVAFYNRELGSKTIFDTVIISTGVASVPYLSRTMKAPVLPTQFLISCDTVKEIVTVLQCAKDSGIDSYSTLGYDGSVAMAVAWVKLLNLPPLYIEFLKEHQVKNIVLAGTITMGAGEGTAKKIRYNSSPDEGYNQGDIFLLHTNGGTAGDTVKLESRIKDLKTEFNAKLEPDFRQISDWESGLVEEQISNFAITARAETSVKNIKLITATAEGGTLELYNLATYLTLAFMKKNNAAFPSITGVALNPYLLSHALYETKIRFIPLLYWQLSPAANTVNRLDTVVGNAVMEYYPDTSIRQLNIWVNTSLNFGGGGAASLITSLKTSGYLNQKVSDPEVEELWNPVDGMTAVCETVASDILAASSPAALKAWDDQLTALVPSDLDAIASKFSNIVVITR